MDSEVSRRQELLEKEADKPVKYTDDYRILENTSFYFSASLWKRLPQNKFNTFSIIDKKDNDRLKYAEIFHKMKQQSKFDEKLLQLDLTTSRAIAVFLGLGICDALGASTQFIPFEKNRRHLIENDFSDVVKQIKNKVLGTRSGKVGIWTDDCSMALSMADSLLMNQFQFKPQHIRYLFILWLEHGLGNGGRPHSIGLGGNIAISMRQFMHKQADFCEEGDKFNNGNGSIMRLAPVPICFMDNEEEAMKFSESQSRTTHNGQEAKECARLLALILVRLIKRKEGDDWKEVIDEACKNFETSEKTVKFLALSKEQPKQLFQEQIQKYKGKFTKFNKKLYDRNWNWKDPEFIYSPTRTDQQPGYIGSYCMDALSMALHTVWNTKSFKEMALMNANMGGDCDTVGAVAGQIAGAVYGIDEEMLKLYSQMEDWKSGRLDVFLKAYKLAMRKSI